MNRATNENHWNSFEHFRKNSAVELPVACSWSIVNTKLVYLSVWCYRGVYKFCVIKVSRKPSELLFSPVIFVFVSWQKVSYLRKYVDGRNCFCCAAP